MEGVERDGGSGRGKKVTWDFLLLAFLATIPKDISLSGYSEIRG